SRWITRSEERMHQLTTISFALLAIVFAGTASFAHPNTVSASNNDAALDAAYKHLLTRLNAYQKEQLRRSEDAWVLFRDAQCSFEGSVLIGGALGIEQQAQADAQAICLLRETRLRTQTLRLDYKRPWDGTN